MAVAVEFKNLNYAYDTINSEKKNALTNINLKIEEGEYVCVVGHTGSGKTTLLKHINGILKPTSGEVLVFGNNIWEEKKNFKENNFKIGYVFQNPAYQLFEETVEKDIAFGPKNLGLSEVEVKNRVKKAAEIVGLTEETLKKSPFEISGGQKKRAAIAGVIAINPKILLLDEPTAGLDPEGKNNILKIIKKYNEEFLATVIVVTHSMEDIYSYANKILVLNEGKVFSYGEIEKTFERAAELQKIGLDVPDVTKVFLKLKERGFNVPLNIYSVEKAVEFLENLKKEERVCWKV